MAGKLVLIWARAFLNLSQHCCHMKEFFVDVLLLLVFFLKNVIYSEKKKFELDLSLIHI